MLQWEVGPVSPRFPQLRFKSWAAKTNLKMSMQSITYSEPPILPGSQSPTCKEKGMGF